MNVLQSVQFSTMRGEMLFHPNGYPGQITFRGKQGRLAGEFGEVTIGHGVALMARLTLDQRLEALTIDAAGSATWKKGDLQLSTKDVQGNDLALLPKEKGESIRFTGTFHLKTSAAEQQGALH